MSRHLRQQDVGPRQRGFVFFLCVYDFNEFQNLKKNKVLAKVAKADDIRPGLFEKHVLFFTMLFFSESNYL